MVCPRWLLIMVFVCRPGFGSLCCDFRDMDKILDCLHLCTSVTRSESDDLSESAQQRYDEEDDDLLLSIILFTLTSEDRTSEFDPTAHRDERRSYSMEHFRWGKPPGRKRQPIKVFASPLEGGLVPGLDDLTLRARRHLRSKAKGKGGVLKAGHQSQSWLRPRGRPSDLPEKKYGTYRMSHFRWGSPPAAKRNGRFLKLREENQLAQFLQNILMKNV